MLCEKKAKELQASDQCQRKDNRKKGRIDESNIAVQEQHGIPTPKGV